MCIRDSLCGLETGASVAGIHSDQSDCHDDDVFRWHEENGALLHLSLIHISGFFCRILPSVAIAAYAVKPTTVSELISGMERIHMPKDCLLYTSRLPGKDALCKVFQLARIDESVQRGRRHQNGGAAPLAHAGGCLLYTSDVYKRQIQTSPSCGSFSVFTLPAAPAQRKG